jgi:hypothetical protein
MAENGFRLSTQLSEIWCTVTHERGYEIELRPSYGNFRILN